MRRAYATAASSSPYPPSASLHTATKRPSVLGSLSSGPISPGSSRSPPPPPPPSTSNPFTTRPHDHAHSQTPPHQPAYLARTSHSSSTATTTEGSAKGELVSSGRQAGLSSSRSSSTSPSAQRRPPRTTARPLGPSVTPAYPTSQSAGGAVAQLTDDGLVLASSPGPASVEPAKVGQPLPTCLRTFLPPKNAIQTTTLSPTIARLPPPPPREQIKLLSDLLGLLTNSDWKGHTFLARTYHQLDSSLLTPNIHQRVAAEISVAPINRHARIRLTKVVERLKSEGVEVTPPVQERLMRMSVRCPESAITEGETGLTAVKAWNLLYGDVAALEDTAIKPWTQPISLLSAQAAARRPSSYPTRAAVREMIRSPTTTQASFRSLLAFSPNPGRHLGPLIALHARQYTLVSNLPALLQDPNSEIDTEAINQIIHAFAMDEKLDLAIAVEAYAAFRRHAAGLHWRRVYLERAAKGLYQSYEDATVSFANPILDSLGYSFPQDVVPNRHTYSLLLRACIVRGNLNLALVIFKDMLAPNGLSLRIPGSANGPKHAPPVILETFLPGLQDYIALFAGFHQHGETEGLHPEECHTYDDRLGVLMPPQEGGGKESSQVRIWRAEVMKETTKVWEGAMENGWVEKEVLDDPGKPKYDGELSGRRQFMVNLATENRRWSLRSLLIVFRSFLSLLPSGEIPSPNPLPTYLPPTPPRFLPSSSLAPHPTRILWILQAFCLTTNYNPHILRGAYDALEHKFGPGNGEGWEGWKVGEGTVGLMRACGVGEGVRVTERGSGFGGGGERRGEGGKVE